MRLIDVEAARHPHHHDARAAPESAPSRRPKGSAALLPHAVAKFLNALLKLFFIAKAEILRAALRPADTHGLRRAFRAGSVQRQTSDVVVLPAAASNRAAFAARSAKRRKRIFHRQALETAPRCGQRR